jgi:hypothetical protein
MSTEGLVLGSMVRLRFLAESLQQRGKGSVTGRAQRAEGKP